MSFSPFGYAVERNHASFIMTIIMTMSRVLCLPASTSGVETNNVCGKRSNVHIINRVLRPELPKHTDRIRSSRSPLVGTVVMRDFGAAHATSTFLGAYGYTLTSKVPKPKNQKATKVPTPLAT